MRVTFLNVGQADSTLVTDGHSSMLIDGATKAAIKGHRKLLRGAAPALTRIVGTHYDQDHLSGLCEIVSTYGGAGIEAAILPPVLDPVRRGELANARTPRSGSHSPWLAEVLQDLGLLETLRPLVDPDSEHANEEAIRRFRNLNFDRLREHVQSTRQVSEGEESIEHVAANELREWLPQIRRGDIRLVDDNLLDVNLIERVIKELAKLIRKLPVIGEVLNVALEIARTPDPLAWWTRSLLARELGDAFYMVATVAEATIVAATLNKLVEILDEKDIPWYSPIAEATSKVDFELLPGFATAHLAPTETWLKLVWDKLPTLRKPGEDKGLPRVPISNELSHVMAVFSWGCPFIPTDWPLIPSIWQHGFLATGDSDMEELSSNAKIFIAKCTLVDVSHHGGSWGSFPDVIAAAYSSGGPPIELYVSIKKDRGSKSPPGVGNLDDLLKELRKARGARLWLSNLQPGATCQWASHSPADGPDTTVFGRSFHGWVPQGNRGLCI
jgi:Metallo-beta-lactamase superfamily